MHTCTAATMERPKQLLFNFPISNYDSPLPYVLADLLDVSARGLQATTYPSSAWYTYMLDVYVQYNRSGRFPKEAALPWHNIWTLYSVHMRYRNDPCHKPKTQLPTAWKIPASGILQVRRKEKRTDKDDSPGRSEIPTTKFLSGSEHNFA